MRSENTYDLALQFFNNYQSNGFADIAPDQPFVLHMEEELKRAGQFFYIGDLIRLRVLFVSRGYYRFFGQIPAESYPYAVFEASHPDNKQRHSVARTSLIRLAQDMYNNNWKKMILSTNLRIQNMHGEYIHLAFQGYLIYSEIPYPSVFLIMVHTDIGSIVQIKHGYHFYVGTDKSFFSYPTSEKLMTGNVFTDREFEIIKCIAAGLNSKQIAEKLFLSVHTINTHRRNIVTKTNKSSTLELVIDLQEKGII